MSRIVVVGTGAWGTALALHGIRAGHHVVLVARDERQASVLRTSGQNPRSPGFRLPDQLEVRHELPDAADLLLWAVPTQHLRASILHFRPMARPIVVCAKGVEANTMMLPLEIIYDLSPQNPLAVLTGPNFAQEVATGLPAAAVVASRNAPLRDAVRTMLGNQAFRLYSHDDPVGAQVGGAAKNVIAIAAGAVIGAGLGENARAALITRGLSEICRLTVSLGGRMETVMGLSGIGDLLLTCTGFASRNFSLGHALGCGETLSAVLARRSAVTEGVMTAAALVARAGGTELPICAAVADLLAGTKTLNEAIVQLMSRPLRDE